MTGASGTIWRSPGITTEKAAGVVQPGTFDLGVFFGAATVTGVTANVTSGGTVTHSWSIGTPGTLTAIGGLTSIATSSASDSTTSATSANTASAGQHLYVVISITGTPVGLSAYSNVQS